MAATATQVTRLRRMVAEPNDSNGYTDAVLKEAIERYPLLDANGYEPTHSDWTATYDLNAAAADVWTEKAAGKTGNMDWAADGGSYKQQQQYANAMKMAKHYAARRSPTSIKLIVEDGPLEEDE